MENEAENKRESDTRDEDNLSYLMKTGGVISQSAGETIHCLTIIGQIEGHYLLGDGQKATKYEHLIPLLVSIEESDEIDGLLLVLNTMGGDVEAGLALAEMIASMKKPTVSLVLGGGHSIGVPLAVSAKASFIVPSATMTIHPVRISVTSHSAVSEECFREMLLRTDQIATDVGSLIDGREAVGCGLIDHTGGLSDALDALRCQIRAEKDHASSDAHKECAKAD